MTMKEEPCFRCLLFIFMIPFATFFLTLSVFKVCCLYCHLKLIFDSIGLSSQRAEEGLMFTEH